MNDPLAPLSSLAPLTQDFFDEMEAQMLTQGESIEFPLRHTFTPGLYSREIFMPAGSLIISKIHRTEHPFVISQGDVSVLYPDGSIERYKAPYQGVTLSGTQRFLYCHEDTVWTTFHCRSDDENAADIEARIIEPHVNRFLKEAA